MSGDEEQEEQLPKLRGQVVHVSSDAAAVGSKLGNLEFAYATTGLFAGLLVSVVGAVLFALGLTAKTSLTMKMVGLTAEMSDGPPGAVLVILGLCIIFITRPKITIGSSLEPRNKR